VAPTPAPVADPTPAPAGDFGSAPPAFGDAPPATQQVVVNETVINNNDPDRPLRRVKK